MNTESPDPAPLKFDELLARCMGEIDFAHKILRDFINSSTPLFDEIKTCLTQSELPSMAQKVHRLKGTAATVAARPLLETLLELEQLLRQETQPDVGELNDAWELSVQRYSDVQCYIETQILQN
jgi:HPt (histidine-containing phosphotransfer) domain-containing protein